MSFAERNIVSQAPPYYNRQYTGYVAFGGTFTGGQIGWKNLISSASQAKVVFVSVSNATWSETSAVSDKNIIPSGTFPIIVYNSIYVTGGNYLKLQVNYDAINNFITSVYVATNVTYPNTPQSSTFLVIFDEASTSMLSSERKLALEYNIAQEKEIIEEALKKAK
jgi:hypothetical protein